MGFFDTFVDTPDGKFITSEEKQVLIDEKVAFPILAVTYQAQSQYGPRFLVTTEIEGETRLLSFNTESVESRDRMLEALVDYLEAEDAETPHVFLEKAGRAILIRNADAA